MRKIPWIVAVAIFAICSVAMAVNIQTQTIANTAYVFTPKANITAYSDEACTQLLEKIDWGNIYEGIKYSKTFWVKNEGDDAVAAEWHDDIEEARTLHYDYSYMEYYNPKFELAEAAETSGSLERSKCRRNKSILYVESEA